MIDNNNPINFIFFIYFLFNSDQISRCLKKISGPIDEDIENVDPDEAIAYLDHSKRKQPSFLPVSNKGVKIIASEVIVPPKSIRIPSKAKHGGPFKVPKSKIAKIAKNFGQGQDQSLSMKSPGPPAVSTLQLKNASMNLTMPQIPSKLPNIINLSMNSTLPQYLDDSNADKPGKIFFF